nr:efflux RND transporter periplasmic adaptor subunit [Neoroseomonas eburnea]
MALVPLAAIAACDEAAPPQQQSAAPPAVAVITVERQPIASSAEFIGRVEAIDKVEVRARVTGYLTARHFNEGDMVKAGDPLFTIEQAPFAAEVALRQAQVERAEAELQNATTQVERGRELLRTNDLSQARFDDRVTEQSRNQANLAAARAELDQARIQYGYTSIRTVFDGRAGRSPLSPGNVVGPDSGVLVTVVRDDPIRVVFPVTQRELLRVRRASAGGEADAANRIQVLVRLPDGTLLDTIGRLDFVDVTANRSTDSVMVTATVPNGQHLLTDGQSVTVVLREAQPQQAIVIPQSAIQIDQQGVFVLVVGADNKVEVKRIRTSRGPAGQVVVTEGLEVGQLIIVEGSQRARPGQPVTPRPLQAPPEGAVPANAARAG